MIVEALRRVVPGLKGVVGRDEVGRDDAGGSTTRRAGAAAPQGEEAPQPLTITERGVKFLVDVYAGQKTGFFGPARKPAPAAAGVQAGRCSTVSRSRAGSR